MKQELKDRVLAFGMLELPGQPQGMHMGTSHLVGDLVAEIRKLESKLEHQGEPVNAIVN